MEKTENSKKFDFWQNHSEHYLEMALRTDKHEIKENPDGYGKRTGVCGDTIEFFITVREDHLESVSFHVDGCINTNACANTVAMLAEGKQIDEAWEITWEQIRDYLGTLPSEEIHCAELAVGAFYLALTDFQENKKFPWKKLYRQRRA